MKLSIMHHSHVEDANGRHVFVNNILDIERIGLLLTKRSDLSAWLTLAVTVPCSSRPCIILTNEECVECSAENTCCYKS